MITVKELNEILKAHPDYSVGVGGFISYAPIWVDEHIDVMGMDFKLRNDAYMTVHITGKEGKEGYITASDMLADTEKCNPNAHVLFLNDNDDECIARVEIREKSKEITIY